MISEAGPEGVASRREAARALGNIPGPHELHAELEKLIDDPDDDVAGRALLSAGRVRIIELLPKIVDGLREPHRLGAARAALVQYEDAAVETLRERLNDTATSSAVRRQIPKVLARIGTAEAARALSGSLIQSDPEVRYEVIKALNQIHARHPDRMSTAEEISRMLDYELLAYYRSFQILGALDAPNGIFSAEIRNCNRLVTQAVRERMEQELERVFRLLSLIYPSADVHNSYLSLTSHRPQMQANALEMLEHLLPSDLYRRLAAVADPESTAEGRLERVRRLCQAGVESGPEALRILLHSGDGWLCGCALHTIGLARLTEMQSEVGALRHEDFLLEGTLKWTNARLNGGQEERGAAMLSLLEKVDLLRNAKLFQPLPTQSLVRVAAIAQELNWAPHQMVYHEGSRAESILMVLEGEVELIRGGNVVAKVGPHQAPGVLAALSSGRYSESAVVSQPTRALRMDRDEFFEAMAEDFRVARGIVKALAGMANGVA
jgi:hypothetical protein